MSCCSATYDNKNCPLKMEDGRAFTNYQPRCIRNAYLNDLLSKHNITTSSYEQRLFLQRNSDKIIEQDRQIVINQLLPCIPCNRGELINDKILELDNKNNVFCDNVSCYTKETNYQGLGTTKSF